MLAELARALTLTLELLYPAARPARQSPKRRSNPVKTPLRLRLTSAALPSLSILPQAPTPCAQNVRSGVSARDAIGEALILKQGFLAAKAKAASPAASPPARVGPTFPSAAMATPPA